MHRGRRDRRRDRREDRRDDRRDDRAEGGTPVTGTPPKGYSRVIAPPPGKYPQGLNRDGRDVDNRGRRDANPRRNRPAQPSRSREAQPGTTEVIRPSRERDRNRREDRADTRAKAPKSRTMRSVPLSRDNAARRARAVAPRPQAAPSQSRPSPSAPKSAPSRAPTPKAPPPKPRPSASPRATPKSRPAPRPASRPQPRMQSPRSVRDGAPRKLELFPDGGYDDAVVVASERDCAVEEQLTLFIPNERLDAARFDGLTLIIRDVTYDPRSGETRVYDERPLFVPPNYIEGFRLATGRR